MGGRSGKRGAAAQPLSASQVTSLRAAASLNSALVAIASAPFPCSTSPIASLREPSSAALALMWGWVGIVYHGMFFAPVVDGDLPVRLAIASMKNSGSSW